MELHVLFVIALLPCEPTSSFLVAFWVNTMFLYPLVFMFLSFFLVFMPIMVSVVHTLAPFYHFGV